MGRWNENRGTDDSFEWWYFDAHLNDGSTLVIGFYTKPVVDQVKTLSPYVSFSFNTPDGIHIAKMVPFPADLFSASKNSCDVQIGKNTFKGDLHHYDIHSEMDNIAADIALEGTVPAWRPGTGFSYYGEHDEEFFAWLPSVPQGNVKATITAEGITKQYTGIGYHDHNWGNAPMLKLMHHWYWGRAKIGDYTVISAFIVSEKQYGYMENLVFMLAKDGKIIADNSQNKVTFRASEQTIDENTGKPFDSRIVYSYDGDLQHYRVTYIRKDTIVSVRMIDTLPKEKQVIAEKIGFNGAYLRFTGDVIVERIENDVVVESVTETGLWELMYFGNPITDEQR